MLSSQMEFGTRLRWRRIVSSISIAISCARARIAEFFILPLCAVSALIGGPMTAYAQTASSRPYQVGWYDFTASNIAAEAAAGASLVVVGQSGGLASNMPALLNTAQGYGMKVIIDLNLSQCAPWAMDASTF